MHRANNAWATAVASAVACLLTQACVRTGGVKAVDAPRIPDIASDLATGNPSALSSAILVGTVSESGSGRAIVGASVLLTPQRESARVHASTDAFGGFVLKGINPGSYKVLVRYVGHYPFAGSFVARQGSVDTLRVSIKPAFVMQGRILTPTARACMPPDYNSTQLAEYITEMASGADSVVRASLEVPRVRKSQVYLVTNEAVCTRAWRTVDSTVKAANPMAPAKSVQRPLYVFRVGSYTAVSDPLARVAIYFFDEKWTYVNSLLY